MALLEQVTATPNWMGALEVALLRPPGVPERRSGEDPWQIRTGRPRRISDDLAWFRDAMDEPDDHGLETLPETATEGAWRPVDEDPLGRLQRLRERGVLDAAGFLLHD
ncbi:MAG TPA: hypothetical protein VD931_13095 [Baekduia sp.]|nr:hypothetical protein [Baekduia sp.]